MHKEYNEGPRCYLEEFSNSDWVVSMCTQLQNARVSSVPNNNELVKPHGKAHANELCKAIALRKGVTIENTRRALFDVEKGEMTMRLVNEFYANLTKKGQAFVIVHGKQVKWDAKTINNLFGLDNLKVMIRSLTKVPSHHPPLSDPKLQRRRSDSGNVILNSLVKIEVDLQKLKHTYGREDVAVNRALINLMRRVILALEHEQEETPPLTEHNVLIDIVGP
ncbi:hypothetical protein V6N12_024651 [Hibiscus sabdariffa]|uniref:Uncharacterized protein n=1 Tax=Hibiscus sabdariffa TaxID=183260 RepID=A0ABR2G180_9ROSI